jgi:hypothetical protein
MSKFDTHGYFLKSTIQFGYITLVIKKKYQIPRLLYNHDSQIKILKAPVRVGCSGMHSLKYTREVSGLLYFVKGISKYTRKFSYEIFYKEIFIMFFQRAKIRLGCFLTWFFYFWMFSIVITTSDRFCSVIWGFLTQCNFSLPPWSKDLMGSKAP